MRQITIDTWVQAARGQVSTDLGGESVILDVQSGMYYGLDEVGARIWELIQAPARAAAVRDALLAEYDVEPAACEQDMLELLTQLRAAGLVEVVDAAGA
ncbi:MAG: lasso peptide biosynthesis PqqD family chaperone [Anaerolineales bacterium]|nr:lasso peptide biosynthesis PqqD family chaperone [Anaerolineales bacterium]